MNLVTTHILRENSPSLEIPRQEDWSFPISRKVIERASAITFIVTGSIGASIGFAIRSSPLYTTGIVVTEIGLTFALWILNKNKPVIDPRPINNDPPV